MYFSHGNRVKYIVTICKIIAAILFILIIFFSSKYYIGHE